MNNQKKILIIEDDEHISRVYEALFAKEGIATSVAVDGDEGIKKVIAEKPDLIILDLMLPKRDGFSVLEEIKKTPELAHIPVIVLSNLGETEDVKRALSLGAKEHLVKVNHSTQQVVDKVKEYLMSKD